VTVAGDGGVALLLDTALTRGLVLGALQRWTLPPGALTVLLTLNALAMRILCSQGDPHPLHLAARTLSGLTGDSLGWGLRPSGERLWAWRGCAGALPARITAWDVGMLHGGNGL